MQTALNVAAYALGATVLAGVVLLGMLAYDLWWSDRFRVPRPSSMRLACTALEAAREVYGRLKLAYAKVPARERRHLDLHLRRMGERVQYVEDKTFAGQDPYYRAVARRDKLWRAWKALHAQVSQMSRSDRKRSRHLLDEAASGYRKANEAVQEEWERGGYRDKLLQQELRALGLLDEDYLPRLLEQVRAHTARSPAEGESRQEPGAEPGLDSGEEPGMDDLALEKKASAGTADQASADAKDRAEGSGEPSAHPAPATARVPPRGIGRLSAERILAFLAPLFGRKAEPEQASPAPVAADTEVAADAWRPAPPPPRVQSRAPQQPAGTTGAATAGAVPASGAAVVSARATEPAVLRQQDVQGAEIAAPGRRYGDPAFSVAGLPRGILRQADLSGSSFAGVRFTGRHRYLDCRFTGADLSGIVLEAQSRAHQFVRCDFSGAQFGGSRLGFVLFHECDLSGSRWDGARLARVRFSDCMLEGADWRGAEFLETQVPGGLPSPQPAPAKPHAAPAGPLPDGTAPRTQARAEPSGPMASPAEATASPASVPPTPPVETPT